MTHLTFAGMYQLGYIVRDVDRAAERFGALFGIDRFRIVRHGPDIATAHAWIREGVMVELVEVGPNGPAYFQSYVPDDPAQARFHHNAYRVHGEAEWDHLRAAVREGGFWHDVVSVKDGDMNVMFVDLREATGAYAEYVYLKGAMLSYYDDVPENYR